MWQIRFYEDRRGKSPVLEYLNKLPVQERAKAYNAIRLLAEFGPDLNMPHAKRIEGHLWELRPGANRLFYFLLVDQTFVILHGFRKQSQKTPELEIQVAQDARVIGGTEMSPLSKTTFQDWETEQLQNPEFAEAIQALEPGYQIARLRIQRGLTQAQLADLVGTHQPSIARLESGLRHPSLSFLQRVAEVLQARVEVNLVPLEATKLVNV